MSQSKKENFIPYYQHMSNEQLFDMANEQLQWLDADAIDSYYSTVESRGLSLICSLTHMESNGGGCKPAQLSKHNMQFLLQSIEQKRPIPELTSELRSRGIDAWCGYKILKALPEFLEEKIVLEKEKALNGSMLFFSGLAFRLLPLSSSKHLALIILVYSITAFGAIKWLDAFFRFRRYRKMIQFLSSSFHQSDSFAFPIGEDDAVV